MAFDTPQGSVLSDLFVKFPGYMLPFLGGPGARARKLEKEQQDLQRQAFAFFQQNPGMSPFVQPARTAEAQISGVREGTKGARQSRKQGAKLFPGVQEGQNLQNKVLQDTLNRGGLSQLSGIFPYFGMGSQFGELTPAGREFLAKMGLTIPKAATPPGDDGGPAGPQVPPRVAAAEPEGGGFFANRWRDLNTPMRGPGGAPMNVPAVAQTLGELSAEKMPQGFPDFVTPLLRMFQNRGQGPAQRAAPSAAAQRPPQANMQDVQSWLGRGQDTLPSMQIPPELLQGAGQGQVLQQGPTLQEVVEMLRQLSTGGQQ